MRWIIIVIIGLVIIGMQNTLPKETVAQVNGTSCSVDTDCPCWGQIKDSDIVAYGLGSSLCTEGTCDTTFCLDVQPVGEFIRDRPWQWLRDNPIMLFVIIGLIALLVYWPKV